MKKQDSHLKRLIEQRMKDLNIRYVRDLERRAGLTRDVVRNILRGTTKTVRAESVEPLARALKVSMAEIIGAQGADAQIKAMARATVLRLHKATSIADQQSGKATILSMVAIEGEIAGVEPDAETDYLLLVPDDSMAPTFGRGDAVLIRSSETEPETGQVYLLAPSKTAAPILRRINIRLSDGLYDAIADNDSFPKETGIKPAKVAIIGRALVAFKRL